MSKVSLQLNRLRRHYESALVSYDEVSLLDLSHVLRIWTELKIPLKIISPKFSDKKVFKSSTPGRKILKLARRCEYVFAYMPGGVITRANSGVLLSFPHKSDEKLRASISTNQLDTHLEIRNFALIGDNFKTSLYSEFKQETIKAHTFVNWLGTEAVRCGYFDEKGEYKEYSISREMIIKRVANTLDGSHHSTLEGGERDNKFDAPVHRLLKYKVGGLPLPYFILMKISQDIINNSGNMFDE